MAPATVIRSAADRNVPAWTLPSVWMRTCSASAFVANCRLWTLPRPVVPTQKPPGSRLTRPRLFPRRILMNLTSLIIQLISGCSAATPPALFQATRARVPSGIRSPVPLAAVSAVRS